MAGKRITGKQRVARKKNIVIARRAKKKSGKLTSSRIERKQGVYSKSIKMVQKKSSKNSAKQLKIIKKYGNKWDGIKSASKSDQKKLKSINKEGNRLTERIRKMKFRYESLSHKSLYIK